MPVSRLLPNWQCFAMCCSSKQSTSQLAMPTLAQLQCTARGVLQGKRQVTVAPPAVCGLEGP